MSRHLAVVCQHRLRPSLTGGMLLVCRAVIKMRQRSRAIRSLPGPKYPWLLGFMALVQRKDVHRYATELAEQYGPIFKFRIVCFHVRKPLAPIDPLQPDRHLCRACPGASARHTQTEPGMWRLLAQVICITDPVLATQMLRSKAVDKLRFQYSFLDVVRTLPGMCLSACPTGLPSRACQPRRTHDNRTSRMQGLLC